MTTWMSILLVALAGGVGSLTRFFLGLWSNSIPWGILFANTLGSFIAGVAISLGLGWEWVAIGLAGGISTFSTFAAQSFDLIRKGRPLLASQNLVLNLLLPAAGFLTGTILL